jgi:hypothetical protein
MTGVDHIAAEREHQIKENKYTVERDVEHYRGAVNLTGSALVDAAICIAVYPYSANDALLPDWARLYAAKTTRTAETPVQQRIHRLRISGALLAAEIDRLQATSV